MKLHRITNFPALIETLPVQNISAGNGDEMV